jgi:hypothetical protein
MAIKTRKEVREQLGSLLDTALTGDGNPAQDVFDYLNPDFAPRSPIVCIGSTSVQAFEQNFTSWYVQYGYEIVIFVAREDEQVSEDALDDTMQGVYETLQTNRVLSGWWENLEWGEASETMAIELSGHPYWVETISVIVETYE